MDECGNIASDELEVTVPLVPVTVELPTDISTTCLVTNNLQPAVSGGAGILDYAWTINGQGYSNATSINYSTETNAAIELTVEDECGNVGYDEMQVIIPAVPVQVSTTADTTICLNDGALLTGSASGGVGDLVLSWEGGSNQSTIYATPTVSSAYRLFVQDECGNSASATVFVTVDFVEPNFISAYLDDELVGFTNLLPDSVVTFWEFSDGTISNDKNPVHRFNTVDEWVATLHAYSLGGCHNDVSQTFEATGAVFIPTAFTPDADGINDYWKPVGRDLVSYHLSVFNRYGEIVFETRDMEEYWDGGMRGGDYFVPNGVYSFILQATDARYNSFERSGHVQIAR
jgi:gliding motility-associated-like protein